MKFASRGQIGRPLFAALPEDGVDPLQSARKIVEIFSAIDLYPPNTPWYCRFSTGPRAGGHGPNHKLRVKRERFLQGRGFKKGPGVRRTVRTGRQGGASPG